MGAGDPRTDLNSHVTALGGTGVNHSLMCFPFLWASLLQAYYSSFLMQHVGGKRIRDIMGLDSALAKGQERRGYLHF